MNKSELIEKLNSGVVSLEFTKVDGTTRLMEATLSKEHGVSYDKVSAGGATEKPGGNAQPVWDVSSQGWRSFRWSSVISVDGVTVSGINLDA